MITLLTETKNIKELNSIIKKIDRLDELVTVTDKNIEAENSDAILIIKNQNIQCTLDWRDNEPPLIIPTIAFEENNLLGIIFLKLKNYQKAFEYFDQKHSLYNITSTFDCIINQQNIPESLIEYNQRSSKHNYAILLHYGLTEQNIEIEDVISAYQEALVDTVNEEEKAFTLNQYFEFLLLINQLPQIEKILNEFQNELDTLSPFALNILDKIRAYLLSSKLQFPIDQKIVEEIIILMQKVIQFYEEKKMDFHVALVQVELGKIATLKEDFNKAKDVFQKAILCFDTYDRIDLKANANYEKGVLFYTWSKKNNPQYYKMAINTFQDCLKYYKKETNPTMFANIHHFLGLIYSEMKASEEEKPLWDAFCASSFKKALEFYTKDEFPYDFAMICHNFATAMINFPVGKLSDHLVKSNQLFEDALSIRTHKDYPYERALTLLNQLELFWRMNNEDKKSEKENYELMQIKANEIKALTDNESLLDEVENHLLELKKLKTILEKDA